MVLFPELVYRVVTAQEANGTNNPHRCSLFDHMVPYEFDEEELCMMQANPAYRVVLAEFCF
jgi:hypothetical protein